MVKIEFEINAYLFVDRKTKQGMIIYARTKEIADRLISIENECNIYRFKKPIFRRHIRPCITTKPPYDIENEQEQVLEKRREHRINYYKEKKNEHER